MTSDQCGTCEWFESDWRCAAFRDEPIPDEIATGLFDHTKAYPGDHGIRFKLVALDDEDTQE